MSEIIKGSKLELLAKFGYVVDEIHPNIFSAFIKDDPSAFRVTDDNKQVVIDEAFDNLCFEADGYVLEVVQ